MMAQAFEESTDKFDQIAARFVKESSNPHTRRARAGDIIAFLQHAATPNSIRDFLTLRQDEAARCIWNYRSAKLSEGQSKATVNRHSATMRGLVKFAKEAQLTDLRPDGLVRTMTVDDLQTDIISTAAMDTLVASVDATTLQGQRDKAILSLSCHVPLHRAELCARRVRDYSAQEGSLIVPRAGPVASTPMSRHRRPEGEGRVTLQKPDIEYINVYLEAAGHKLDLDGPLFRNLDRRPVHTGSGLVPHSILHLVRHHGNSIGLPKLTPRQLRASVIVAALDAVFGDVEQVLRRFPHLVRRTVETYEHYRRSLRKKEEQEQTI
jgi:integrase